ncbi:HET-domain-containing protein [Rhizopogon vinicolor AM-OR11-026]|uniref:HET-domain-containing protein n=1 Tax=Rhizopogon vinicolor AM-OR11-026 TaxID=1314800 RepID=A0A1B7MEB8_9AGAM|nr:HET-domain-containing protein [Rhizopogon vinicolor AM-OR11-026]
MNAFRTSTEYNELLSLTPLLYEIQDRSVYELDPADDSAKLQSFCEVVRDAGYRWAWSDTYCIDQNNNIDIQQSVKSMFVWYRHSALTIIYLWDVSSSSKSGAMTKSAWNSRGWTIQESPPPKFVLFYQAVMAGCNRYQ